MLAETSMADLQRIKRDLAISFLHRISKLLNWLHDNLGVAPPLISRLYPDEKMLFADLVLWRRGKHVLSIQQGKYCVFQGYLWVQCQNCGALFLPREVPRFAKTEFCSSCGEQLSAEVAYDRMVASWP